MPMQWRDHITLWPRGLRLPHGLDGNQSPGARIQLVAPRACFLKGLRLNPKVFLSTCTSASTAATWSARLPVVCTSRWAIHPA
jgi:hypothetical protein